jgi:uncharacterized heparinase superfamily protein
MEGSPIHNLIRLYHTLKYLKTVQWLYRVKNGMQALPHRCLPGLCRARLQSRVPESIELRRLPHAVPWFQKRHDGSRGMFRGEDVLEGRFRFLHVEKTFDGPCQWRNPDLPILWDFNLHYFEYLSALGQPTASLIDQWIAANPCPTQPGWHPYPLSLRAIHWIKCFTTHLEFAEPHRIQSLYTQMLFLEGNLEGHLQVNHLLENARALVFGGLFFAGSDAERWLAKGLALLRREVQEQILPRGGHFERSPMYHCILLEGLLDACAYLETAGLESGWLRTTLGSMCAWLEAIRCPDGSFPLFNDAGFGISAEPDEILRNAERMIAYRRHHQKKPVRDCDAFYVLDAGDLFCVVDGAPIGPSYNPGHAHSDNFTYELFFRGERLVVDSGTLSYEAGPSRQHFRSTHAHNTVLVNGVEQSEVWGGFRVARRSNPHLSRAGASGGLLAFQGAYRNRVAPALGIEHERLIVMARDRWVLVWDTLHARGEILAESGIHLAPGWSLVEGSPGVRVHHADKGDLFFGPVEVDLVEATEASYAPEFGKTIGISRLGLRKKGKSKVEMGYFFSTEPLAEPFDFRLSRTGEGVEIAFGGFAGKVRFEDLCD